MIDEGKLVSLVRNYKVLYDKDDKNYNNNLKRDTCWRDIANEMITTEKECKTHWKRLREQYRKAIRFRCEATSKRRPWKLELEMSFLLPHMKEITYVPRYSYEGGKTEEEATIENLNCGDSEDETENLISLLPASPESTIFLDSSIRDTSIRSSTDASTSTHPLINFFTSLGETTLTLPHHLQMEVKRKVFDAVHQAEIAALNDVSATKSELE